MRSVFIFVISLAFHTQAYALLEFSAQYGLDKQAFGQNRQNNITSTTYAGSVALYLFNRTAIEVNYSNTETVTNQFAVGRTTADFDIVSSQDKVFVETYGIGLRQAFAGRRARFKPTLSIGYAKRFARGSSSGVVRRNADNATGSFSDGQFKSRDDSVFATLGFDLKLTKTIALRASVQTVFKAFEFNRAQDNMKYLFGFSWYL